MDAFPITIRPVRADDVQACVRVIQSAFATVAEEFEITENNAPRFTAFAVNEERLLWQMENEDRLMFVCCAGDEIVGYYSLLFAGDRSCELNNVSVLPEMRHLGIGGALLQHSFRQARERGCKVMHIGIVEENIRLRRWYEWYGFQHTGTEKFEFFPFTCGYMKKEL